MNHTAPDPLPIDDTLSEHLALTFLDCYHHSEQSLRRAGFTSGARADWGAFTRQVQAKFDPEADPGLKGAVLVLLTDPDDWNLKRIRARGRFLLEPTTPERNTAWLVEIMQEVRSKIVFGLNLTGEPACGELQVSAALYVLDTLMDLDPKVKSLFLGVHRPEDGQGEALGDSCAGTQ